MASSAARLPGRRFVISRRGLCVFLPSKWSLLPIFRILVFTGEAESGTLLHKLLCRYGGSQIPSETLAACNSFAVSNFSFMLRLSASLARDHLSTCFEEPKLSVSAETSQMEKALLSYRKVRRQTADTCQCWKALLK